MSKKFFIEFEIENAAFVDGNHRAEIVRIIRDIADKIESHRLENPTKIRDINGNAIGFVGGFE